MGFLVVFLHSILSKHSTRVIAIDLHFLIEFSAYSSMISCLFFFLLPSPFTSKEGGGKSADFLEGSSSPSPP